MNYARAVVTTEVVLSRSPEGNVRGTLPTVSLEQLLMYKRVSKRVLLVARVREEPPEEPGTTRVQPTGEGLVHPDVTICALPNYHGGRQLVANLPLIIRTLLRIPSKGSLFVGRVPEVLSMLLFVKAIIAREDYLAFVVADAGGALPPFGRFTTLKNWAARTAVKRSAGAVYVTTELLQRLYPPPAHGLTLARSNVLLPEDAFRQKMSFDIVGEPQLVSIGSMASTAKGQDVLLRVVARLKSRGTYVRLVLIGDGLRRGPLQALTEQLGISEQVLFAGMTASARENWSYLDTSDIFVFGSRSEGLPRAVVEAMARSLPVVSTRAGGVGELLESESVVEIDDIDAFATRVDFLLRDSPARMECGKANYSTARTIQDSTRPSRFHDFLDSLAAKR